MPDIILSDRSISIIQMVESRGYIQIEDVAKRLQVGERTIRNDIRQLNFDLDGIAQVRSERGKGSYLYVMDEAALAAVMAGSRSRLTDNHPIYRLAHIIKRLMHHDEVYTMDDLADELFIGKTTLVNELKKAAIPLKSYRLQIEGKPNQGLFLRGREFDLRFFLIEHLYDALFSDYPIGEDVRAAIVDILNHHELESTTQVRVLQFVSVMLERYLKGYVLKEKDARQQELMGTNDYEIAVEIVHVLEKLLPVQIPVEEILFITIPIHGRRTTTNRGTSANITITHDIKELIDEMMMEIGFTKDMVQENESFFTDMEYHLTFLMNRLVFGMRLKNPLLADVKEKYPVAFRMGQIAGDVIERKYKLTITEDEVGYLAFYFGVFIESTDKRAQTIQRAAIICGSGLGTSQLVGLQLERVLKQQTKIDIFSEQQVSNELLADYDFVFSTVDLPFKVSVPYIRINEIFDELMLELEIKKQLYTHGYEKRSGKIHQSTLTNLLSEERVYQLNPVHDYHENVNNMVEDLIQKGSVDPGFRERLGAREKQGSMAFDRFIALPHTFQLQSDEVELALGIFPRKVDANGKEIRLVFLLGLPEKQSDHVEHLIVQIYDEIIRIAGDEKLLAGLMAARTYDDVVKVLH